MSWNKCPKCGNILPNDWCGNCKDYIYNLAPKEETLSNDGSNFPEWFANFVNNTKKEG